jgi:hypothetical protein
LAVEAEAALALMVLVLRAAGLAAAFVVFFAAGLAAFLVMAMMFLQMFN